MKDNSSFLNDLATIKFGAIDTLHHIQYILVYHNDEKKDLVTPIITIGIALIAGLIALYQVKSNTIANSRIIWIENLRNTLSEYCVETADVLTHLKNYSDRCSQFGKLYDGNIVDYEKYFSSHSKSEKLAYKVKLYLNPDEAKHAEIITIIDKVSIMLYSPDVLDTDYTEIKNEMNSIISLTKSVFKEEWRKSKKLFKI